MASFLLALVLVEKLVQVLEQELVQELALVQVEELELVLALVLSLLIDNHSYGRKPFQDLLLDRIENKTSFGVVVLALVQVVIPQKLV